LIRSRSVHLDRPAFFVAPNTYELAKSDFDTITQEIICFSNLFSEYVTNRQDSSTGFKEPDAAKNHTGLFVPADDPGSVAGGRCQGSRSRSRIGRSGDFSDRICGRLFRHLLGAIFRLPVRCVPER
jgi:hypothetical protein